MIGWADDAFIVGRIRLVARGAEIPDDVTAEEIDIALAYAERSSTSVHWWLGDLYNALVRLYGEDDAAQYLPDTPHRVDTIQRDGRVAAAFPPRRRVYDLDHSHYREVAELDTAAQSKLLYQASEEGWTVPKLRAEKNKESGTSGDIAGRHPDAITEAVMRGLRAGFGKTGIALVPPEQQRQIAHEVLCSIDSAVLSGEVTDWLDQLVAVTPALQHRRKSA